ncbi:MAG TPA: glycosyltransferase family 9 protein [Alphaproteobacteria bacterium]|nr:glycosyltransferase family 9 protein [Alphaproteobacteria bacterium]USO05252.1 MAG: glycosyltransferase family 9 protein [Rhodospirillales bacterium]HOO81941.1 glycosyltransferase family 9 protein [Alphaproteobacteria bacterium]
MPDHTNKQKILVIKLSALGDFIQALGPMAAIREHHKDAHITILTTRAFEGFARKCGYFDEVWLDTRPKLLNFKGWATLRKRLNDGKFTRVYDLQNNDRTNFYFKLFKNKPEWIGAAPGASHRNTSPKRTAGHAFDGHVQTLALAEISDIKIDRLDWMNGDLSNFTLKDPYVLLVPGCAPQHPQKRWPAENYARLAQQLVKMNYQPVLIGTESDAAATTTIANTCPEALNLTNQTTLEQIATLGRNAAATIGNDTGPMHLIAATACPCLVLFSVTSNPTRHAPKGENVKVLQKNNLQDLDIETLLQHLTMRESPKSAAKSSH